MANHTEQRDQKLGTEIEVVEDSSDTLALDVADPLREKTLVRKLDYHLMPGIALLYLMCFLDRSNLGNAKIEGMLPDLNMTGDQYHNGLMLFFLGYILFEIPSNIVLKKSSPRSWLPTLTLVWGVVTILFGLLRDTNGFYLARCFLGVAEAGFFPGVVFYLSMWYKRRERQYRISLFLSVASLAGAFGGILAYGIGKMQGVVWDTAWRWIFILEGIGTCVVSVAGYWLIHNYPKTSSFLSQDEKAYTLHRLALDSDALNEEKFTWGAVLDALKDLNCWLYGFTVMFVCLPLYTLSLFLPTIIKDLGYTAAMAQVLTVPPYVFAFVTTLTIANLSEKYGQRTYFVGCSSLVASVGYCLLIGNKTPSRHPGLSYAGVFLAAGGIYPSNALMVSWPAVNVSGQTKRAVAGALQISVANIGGAIAMQLYRAEDAPRFIVGHSVALCSLLANVLLIALLRWRLAAENRRRDGIAPEITDVGAASDWRGDTDPRWRFQY